MALSACAFFLIVAVLVNAATLGNADVIRIFKCPCTFSVVRDKTDPRSRFAQNEIFDILVAGLAARSTARDKRGSIIEKHSSRNIRVRDSIPFDSVTQTNLGKRHIRDEGLFSIRIRHHTTITESPSPTLKLLLHESAMKVICPVVLEPDRPRARFLARSVTEDTTLSALNATSRQSRIEGGLLAAPTLLPYLVSIAIPCRSGEPDCYVSCTGTLIAPKWILTAAHCNIPIGSVVYVSTSVRHGGYSIEVKTWIPHPLYNTIFNLSKKEQYDIAVMELQKNVHNCCVPGPRYMAISFNKSVAGPGSFVRTAGYGFVSDKHDGTDDPGGALRSVDLPVVKNSICREQYFGYSLDLISRKRQICAGYFEDGGCDSCFGDSGGPLVQYNDLQPVLVGVTSFGMGCGKPSFPGIYTRLAGHEEWLRSTGATFKEYQGDLNQVTANCAPGEFLPYNPGKLSICTPCPHNHFSAGGPLRACKRCPATKWRDPEDGSQCSCSARKGYGGSDGVCIECPPGTFSAVGMRLCTKCPFGSFSDTNARGKCKPCPGAPKGATVCNTVFV